MTPKMTVYALVDPAHPEDVRYIGWTKFSPTERLKQHLASARNVDNRTHRDNWLRAVLSGGRAPICLVLAELQSSDEAKAAEIAFIAQHRMCGHLLTNATDGGEGRTGMSVEERAVMSRAMSERLRRLWKNSAYRDSQTTRMIGNTVSRGVKHSKASRENMAAAQRGRERSDIEVARSAEARRGGRRSTEAKEKMSQSQRVRFAKPEQREGLRLAIVRSRGARMHLASGVVVNPFSIKAADINVEDIAHSLAIINRFGGHVERPISVAQHSVYCSLLCDGPHALQALLHDASEYILGDVVKWMKMSPIFAGYRRRERRVQRLIYERFGCSPITADEVEIADRLMVRYEGMKGYGPDWTPEHPAYPRLTPEEIAKVESLDWAFWDWRRAEQAFLERFEEVR